MDRICYECVILDEFGKRNKVLVWLKSRCIEDVCYALQRVMRCKIIEIRRKLIDDGKQDSS